MEKHGALSGHLTQPAVEATNVSPARHAKSAR